MKKKYFFLLFILLQNVFSIFSQVTESEKTLKTETGNTTEGWKFGAVANINVSQTALVNWAAGGESSIALNGIFSAFANYRKGNSSWDNSLDIGYGLLNQGKTNEFRKTDDKLDILSKYGRKAFKDFYYAGLINFKTQFSPGYNYTVTPYVKTSNLLAPAYLIGAIGLNYQPNSYFNAFVAPATGRLTIVNDDDLSAIGAFGVTPGEKLKSEFGGYIRAIYSRNDFKSELLKNVSLTSKIDLFSNYLNNPQNIDVSWENLIALKVNKYIVVSLNTHLLYDADIKFDTDADGTLDIALVQFKEILGIGFSYKF